MGKYTVYDEPFVDKSIQSYLDLILKEILAVIDKNDIEAIILVGGFGRGEGGVWIKGEEVHPVNDFDLTLFPKKNSKKFKQKFLPILINIAEKCARNINIKQIDINVGDIRKFYIRQFTPFFTVNTYEAVNGYKVLFGKLDLNKLKKSYIADKISLIEGLKYFYTRGSGLLIPIYMNALDKKIRPELAYIELSKAKLAIGDSYLILKGKYHFSYSKRIEIANGLSFSDLSNGLAIKSLYIEALGWKIKPKPVSNDFDLKKEISDLIKLFIDSFLHYEFVRLGEEFTDIYDYVKKSSLQKRSLMNKLTARDYFLNKMKIMVLLLATFDLKTDNRNLKLNEIQVRLQKFGVNANKNSFISYTYEYLKIFHPEGIVKEILNER